LGFVERRAPGDVADEHAEALKTGLMSQGRCDAVAGCGW
jgi:hypothetical protein